MLILRIAIIGALLVLFAWSTIRTLRVGRFRARGGTLITRDKNPAWFWASVIVRCALIGGLLVLMRSLIAQ